MNTGSGPQGRYVATLELITDIEYITHVLLSQLTHVRFFHVCGMTERLFRTLSCIAGQ